MSRSYKKFPLFRDNLWGKSLKKGKQYANRKLRRLSKQYNLDIPNGSDYKRILVDSWDLWEYKSYQTEKDVINDWEQSQKRSANGGPTNRSKRHRESTLEEEINWWKSSYVRK
jgi:hypothetical protein